MLLPLGKIRPSCLGRLPLETILPVRLEPSVAFRAGGDGDVIAASPTVTVGAAVLIEDVVHALGFKVPLGVPPLTHRRVESYPSAKSMQGQEVVTGADEVERPVRDLPSRIVPGLRVSVGYHGSLILGRAVVVTLIPGLYSLLLPIALLKPSVLPLLISPLLVLALVLPLALLLIRPLALLAPTLLELLDACLGQVQKGVQSLSL